ncbi:MAG TPA: hypothetical protein ENN81_12875 [Phycisphaerales bacterium]|nr:hypothetical protein [Phycisphaerales bacterium]
MRSQLRVIKADGGVEPYLHTKVMGTVNAALGRVGRADVYLAEQLADVVTYYLYHEGRRSRVASSEILSMVKVVLSSTGHEDAAAALSEHHYERQLKRRRIEVAPIDVEGVEDAALLWNGGADGRQPWEKGRIVRDLVDKHGLAPETARTIASMVEEKVFGMGMRVVPSSLVRQLVLGDTAAVLHAEQALATA